MVGMALNAMHERRARVLASEAVSDSREPRSGLPIVLALLIAIALGTGFVLFKRGLLVLG